LFVAAVLVTATHVFDRDSAFGHDEQDGHSHRSAIPDTSGAAKT
jgi:hypothetical protein